MRYWNRKAQLLILEMAIATMQKIKVEPGVLRYNYKCHINSVHDAINDGQDKVAMCFYIDDDYPIIHFINVQNDKFIDNTLGQWSQKFDYYLIRYIEKDSFWDIEKIFTSYRKELHRKLPFWTRLFITCGF